MSRPFARIEGVDVQKPREEKVGNRSTRNLWWELSLADCLPFHFVPANVHSTSAESDVGGKDIPKSYFQHYFRIPAMETLPAWDIEKQWFVSAFADKGTDIRSGVHRSIHWVFMRFWHPWQARHLELLPRVVMYLPVPPLVYYCNNLSDFINMYLLL